MELNKIINNDCIEYMKTLPDECVDLLITDPPYYKAINESWDKQWKTEEEYLNWCQEWFNECVRVLKKTGSFYCYGNFDILSKQKVNIFDKQLYFRQNITLDKGLKSIAGRTSDKLRMFPTASEYLLFYTKQSDTGLRYIDDKYVKPQNPFRVELIRARIEVNLSTIQVAEIGKFYGKVNHGGSVSNWEKGSNIPTEEQFKKLQTFLPINKTYNELREQYEALRVKYEKERFTFNLPFGITDVWDFTPDKVRYGHKTQKPINITERIIKASSNEGDLVYIPFAGSGSEIISCIKNNRQWIATEIEERYIEKLIKPRISEIS